MITNIGRVLLGQKPVQEIEVLTIESMMEYLHQHGDVTVTTVNGRWWCYFKAQNGVVKIEIDGKRQDGWSIYQAVASCYSEVFKVFR